MTDEQLQLLMQALFDIKAEIRDLRNDLRRQNGAAQQVGRVLNAARVQR